MPPIDPAVLRARAAALPGQFSEAEAVATRVRRLLDEYADLTHRPSRQVVTSEVANAYKAPAPVVRAIVNALRAPAKADPPAALRAVAAIWAGGSREERRIAAELLG